MIHTNPLGAAQDSWLYTFTYTILRNALPFFFLSSSYFFFKKRNWSKYIKRLFIAENQHRAKLRYYVIGLIGFGILEFVETGLLYHFNLIKENDYYFMLIPFAYCFFQLCLIAKVNIDSKRTSYMRKCSIICYFSQFPIIFMCGVLTKYLPFGIDFANFVITIVAANILSYMIIRYSDCYAVLKNLY